MIHVRDFQSIGPVGGLLREPTIIWERLQQDVLNAGIRCQVGLGDRPRLPFLCNRNVPSIQTANRAPGCVCRLDGDLTQVA